MSLCITVASVAKGPRKAVDLRLLPFVVSFSLQLLILEIFFHKGSLVLSVFLVFIFISLLFNSVINFQAQIIFL